MSATQRSTTTCRTPRTIRRGSPRIPATGSPAPAPATTRSPAGRSSARSSKPSTAGPIEPVPARRDPRAARHRGLVAWASRSNGRRSSAIASCRWRGRGIGFPVVDGRRRPADGAVPDRRAAQRAWHVAKVEPGGGMRGPARELGRFYESLLGYRPPRARAAHRRDDGRGAPLGLARRGCSASRRPGVSASPSTSAAARAARVRARRHGVVTRARRPRLRVS